MGHELTRRMLYDLVWSKPMTKVAADLGVSDVALKKTCDKHRVPSPPRGVVTLSQTERNLPTTANVDARNFKDFACRLIVQIGPISLNVTTPCHMLFHLAHPFIRGRKRAEVERAIDRLIDRHGDGNYGHFTLKLTFPPNPNGVYLLKGAGPDVWRKFGVPRCWRKPQGIIRGKRCGVTENIGAAARKARAVHSHGRTEPIGAHSQNGCSAPTR